MDNLLLLLGDVYVLEDLQQNPWPLTLDARNTLPDSCDNKKNVP